MRKTFLVLFVLLFGSLFLLTPYAHAQNTDELLEGTVTKILLEKYTTVENQKQVYQNLEILITKGSIKGKSVKVVQGEIPSVNPQVYEVGDKLVLQTFQDLDGNTIYNIADYQRRNELFILFVIFTTLTIVIGGIWGVTSLLGMAFSFLVIFKFILPQIMSGTDPVLVAIEGAMLIIPVTFYLSHGFNVKTHVSIIGTLITLIVVGLLSTYFVNLTRLSGFSSEEAGFLQSEVGSLINMKGLLLAGIIISSLGILDDITISQASIVKELREANTNLKFKDLLVRGMKVGKDHIASLVNTLVLVYAGSSLPLLLLFISNPKPFEQVINLEIIAEEIVKTLVGSIGLILAVPITTLIAAFYFAKKK
ncbi:MAG: YibE/F family protein [Patescibacteria group bacterium]